VLGGDWAAYAAYAETTSYPYTFPRPTDQPPIRKELSMYTANDGPTMLPPQVAPIDRTRAAAAFSSRAGVGASAFWDKWEVDWDTVGDIVGDLGSEIF
jgi:hypothetical protein